MYTFELKLKEIKHKIRKWNKEEFRHIMKDQHQLNKIIEDLQQQIIQEGRSDNRVKEES